MAQTTGLKRAAREWRFDAVKTAALDAGIAFWIVIPMVCGVAAASYAVAPGFVGVLGAFLAINMIVIAWFDWRYFIIPNWLNLSGLLLGLVHAGFLGSGAIVETVGAATVRGLVTALFFLALRVLYAALRGRQGLGLGDVKLAAVAGVWLGWLIIPFAVQIAAFAALSAYLLRQLLTGRSLSATSRAPFGLFFAPAIWICWVLQTGWLGLF